MGVGSNKLTLHPEALGDAILTDCLGTYSLARSNCEYRNG